MNFGNRYGSFFKLIRYCLMTFLLNNDLTIIQILVQFVVHISNLTRKCVIPRKYVIPSNSRILLIFILQWPIFFNSTM